MLRGYFLFTATRIHLRYYVINTLLDIQSQKSRIAWDETGIAYVVVKTDVLECHQGRDRSKEYNKRRKANSLPKQVNKSRVKVAWYCLIVRL